MGSQQVFYAARKLDKSVVNENEWLINCMNLYLYKVISGQEIIKKCRIMNGNITQENRVIE